MFNFDLKKTIKDKAKNVYYEIKKLYLEELNKNLGMF